MLSQNLKQFFKNHPKVALGFSGGSDSSFLLYTAKEFGVDIQPYFVKTQFQPQFEYDDAVKFCQKLNIKLNVINHDILKDKIISSNPKNRCYYCKKIMFMLIKTQAKADGYDIILDGTNASDDLSDRPGYRAMNELTVLSPLKECGITKNDVQNYLKQVSMSFDKPSYSCLATRITPGISITENTLNKVEKSENFLSSLGFSDFRVRTNGSVAKIQVHDDEFINILKNRKMIISTLSEYFDDITLDLKGR